VTKAIIVAAGKGERLLPITGKIPKPLIEVNGKKIIESLIDAIVSNGIKEIYIVVGYLKEQFQYLKEKYDQIELIENPYYAVCNNISSLYMAREHLGNSIITDADMIVNNQEIFNPQFEHSGYCSMWTEQHTNEWLQTVDENGFVVSCNRNGGKNGYQLFSVSFWTRRDGLKLRQHLEEVFSGKKITDIFWDDIPMFYYKDQYQLQIRKINEYDIIEIDSLAELIEEDATYIDVLSKTKPK